MAHGASETRFTRVWIESGCIQCGWCGDLVPEVFTLGTGKVTVIQARARRDGRSGDNQRERSPLRQACTGPAAEFLEFVAAGCPPQVIHLE